MRIKVEKYGQELRTIETEKGYIKIKCPVCGYENHIFFDPFNRHIFCDGYEIAISTGRKRCMVEFSVEE